MLQKNLRQVFGAAVPGRLAPLHVTLSVSFITCQQLNKNIYNI